MQVSIISRTSKAKYMKKMEKKNLVLEIVWNQPNVKLFCIQQNVFCVYPVPTTTNR